MDAALNHKIELALTLLRKHYQDAVEIIEPYFINNALFANVA